MSENIEVVLYKLSFSQAEYYCRKPACALIKDMEGYAAILKEAAIEVTEVHATWLIAKMTQGEAWSALSGLRW